MIQLLIYGAIAIAILGAVYGVDRSRQAIGERRVEAKYAPVAEQCKSIGNEKPADCATAIRAAIAGRDTCLAANKSLDEQFATFRAMHNQAVEFQNEEFNKAKGRRAQTAAEAAPKLSDVAIEKFNAIVAAKGTGLSCEQLDALLLKEAERKVRFYGPATDAPKAPDGPRVVEPVRPAPVNPLKKTP